MAELLFSINTIGPLILCCLVGCLMRRRGYVGEVFVRDCSNVVFYVAIPCNIFYSIAVSDFQDVFDLKLLLFMLCASVLTAALPLWACRKAVADRRTAATMAHNMYRANFTLLGIPLAVNLLGAEGAAPMMLMVPFGNLFSNILSAVMLSFAREDEGSGLRGNIVRSLGQIITNPMTVASILGILVSWLGIHLPTLAMNTVQSFAQVSGGLALFMLGAQLELTDMRKNWRYTWITVLVRLIAIPAAVLAPAVAMGFRDAELATLFILFSAPTAVTCYVLAESMGGDGRLAGDAVLATSCASTVTLTAGIFLLRSQGLF